MKFKDGQKINEQELREYLESHPGITLTKLKHTHVDDLSTLAWKAGGSYIFHQVEEELIDSFTGESYWVPYWEVIVD